MEKVTTALEKDPTADLVKCFEKENELARQHALLQVTTTVKPLMTDVTVIHQVNMGSKSGTLAKKCLILLILQIREQVEKYLIQCSPMCDRFWERIIKHIKRCLKKAIERALLNDNEFVNLLMTASQKTPQ